MKMIAHHVTLWLGLLLVKDVNADIEAVNTVSRKLRSLATRYNRLRPHSYTGFDKPTPHPTTDDFFYSPYHYGYYGNNRYDGHTYDFYTWPRSHQTYSPTASPTSYDSMVPTTATPSPSPHGHYRKTLHDEHTYHFYQWPESHKTYSPTASPTYVPTTLPPSPPTSSSTQSSSSAQTSSTSSTVVDVLVHEHFLDGFGVFQEPESQDVRHLSSSLGRPGVIQIRNTATLTSYDIATSDADSSQLQVAFSFYANNMNTGEGFCLEYSLNDDKDWNPVRCWQSSIDFENSQWHDDFNVELNIDERIQVDTIRIKLISIASGEDVDIMFDRITLLQQ